MAEADGVSPGPRTPPEGTLSSEPRLDIGGVRSDWLPIPFGFLVVDDKEVVSGVTGSVTGQKAARSSSEVVIGWAFGCCACFSGPCVALLDLAASAFVGLDGESKGADGAMGEVEASILSSPASLCVFFFLGDVGRDAVASGADLKADKEDSPSLFNSVERGEEPLLAKAGVVDRKTGISSPAVPSCWV